MVQFRAFSLFTFNWSAKISWQMSSFTGMIRESVNKHVLSVSYQLLHVSLNPEGRTEYWALNTT